MSGPTSTPAANLEVGDIVRVWWGANRATVSGFRSHDSGQAGWFIVDFGDGNSMTVTPRQRLEKL